MHHEKCGYRSKGHLQRLLQILCLMHKNMKHKLSDRRILQSVSVIFQLSVPTKWNIVEELVTQR